VRDLFFFFLGNHAIRVPYPSFLFSARSGRSQSLKFDVGKWFPFFPERRPLVFPFFFVQQRTSFFFSSVLSIVTSVQPSLTFQFAGVLRSPRWERMLAVRLGARSPSFSSLFRSKGETVLNLFFREINAEFFFFSPPSEEISSPTGPIRGAFLFHARPDYLDFWTPRGGWAEEFFSEGVTILRGTTVTFPLPPNQA